KPISKDEDACWPAFEQTWRENVAILPIALHLAGLKEIKPKPSTVELMHAQAIITRYWNAIRVCPDVRRHRLYGAAYQISVRSLASQFDPGREQDVFIYPDGFWAGVFFSLIQGAARCQDCGAVLRPRRPGKLSRAKRCERCRRKNSWQ